MVVKYFRMSFSRIQIWLKLQIDLRTSNNSTCQLRQMDMAQSTLNLMRIQPQGLVHSTQHASRLYFFSQNWHLTWTSPNQKPGMLMFYQLLQHYKSTPKTYFLTRYVIVPLPNINPKSSWNHFGPIVINSLPVWKPYTHHSDSTLDLSYSHKRLVMSKTIRRSFVHPEHLLKKPSWFFQYFKYRFPLLPKVIGNSILWLEKARFSSQDNHLLSQVTSRKSLVLKNGQWLRNVKPGISSV